MKIGNHRLQGPGIAHLESPNRGGPFAEGQPDTLVIHYTAGAGAGAAIETLTDAKRRVSAHLVVGRDGSIVQLLPFDLIGWHAGKSAWGGREGFNQYSLGIELDNAGQLEEREGRYFAWFGAEYPPGEVVRGVHRNQKEYTFWHRFPPEQIEVVESLCALLVEEYGIRYILGHEEIAPERKIDPGPAFPLDSMRGRLLGGGEKKMSGDKARKRTYMKISAVKTFLIDRFTFVKVETDAGLYGLGEAGLGRRGRAVAEVVRDFEQILAGQDPSRIEHLWQLMFRGGFFPGGVVQTAALSAVDIALWDLKGKALGVPLYELLGGRVRDRVACYPHNGDRRDIDRLVENCRRSWEQGWRFVRWGLCDPAGEELLEPGRALRFGIEQVRAVRQTLGDEVEIIVDVHTRLDPPASIQFCKGVEEYRPFFVEDPLRSESAAGLHLLRRQSSVPIAVGEQFAGKWAFRQVIEEELMDYCRIDLCLAGGLSEARKVAGWCETHYIHLAPHNPLGPVSTAACLHLCLAAPLVGVQELPRVPGTVLPEVFPVQAPFEKGHLLVPQGPGLGLEFDEEAAAAHKPAPRGQLAAFWRDDGSYTNW